MNMYRQNVSSAFCHTNNECPFWTKPHQCGDLDLFGIGLDTNLAKQIPKQMILWAITLCHMHLALPSSLMTEMRPTLILLHI